MARAKMDRLVARALEVANDKWARKGTDRQTQVVTVTRHNITAAFADAIADADGNLPVTEEELRQVGNAAFGGLKKSINRSRISEVSKKLSTSDKVVFTQKRYSPAPFRAMKREGKKELEKILGKELNKDVNQAIDLGAQRLHADDSLTVGLTRLAKVFQVLDRNKFGTATDKFSSTETFKDIFEKYGDILAKIKIVRRGKKETIEYDGQVTIDVKRKAKNFPGSEDADWTQLKPLLEAEISRYISTLDLADQEGSKSIREEAVEQARFSVLNKIPKTKNIRKPVVKQPKSTPKKGSASGKGTKLKAKSNKQPIRKLKKSNAGKSHKASLYTVLALINDKLPETVRKNMGPPRLENQTGRFANSVKMTDVIQTPQGFPSFGYTYRKDPYEVYEKSSGSRFANTDRDPRDLIDASIREIAAGYALGRFYTRRV